MVRNCRLEAVAGVASEAQRYCAIAAASPSLRLTIRDCVLSGRHLIGLFGDARRARIAYCQAGLQLQGGLRDSLVEYLDCRNVPGTFLVKLTSGEVTHNAFIWNKLVDAQPTSLPIGFIFDASRAGGNAEVMSLGGQNLRLRGHTLKGDLTGQSLVLISGEGKGQWRRITQASGDTLTLASPWQVAPQPGDRVYLGPVIAQNLIADNMDLRNDGGLEMLGACLDNHVFWHMSEATRGMALLGTNLGGISAPCYLNSADEVYIYYRGSAGVGAVGAPPPAGTTLAWGQFFYNVDVCDPHVLATSMANTQPSDPDARIEAGGMWFLDRTLKGTGASAVRGNGVSSGRVAHPAFPCGVYVGQQVEGTMIGGLIAYGTPQGYIDRGEETTWKGR
jgi:hypothetical protein